MQRFMYTIFFSFAYITVKHRRGEGQIGRTQESPESEVVRSCEPKRMSVPNPSSSSSSRDNDTLHPPTRKNRVPWQEREQR
ncbi:unnamed protein product [Arctogadus glacialis]